MPAGMRLPQGLLPSMESSEKQTSRSGNACSNGSNNINWEEDRTTPHINKSVGRTQRINGKRDSSVLDVRKEKALEKTRRQGGVYCCIDSCSNVYGLKSRQGTHTAVFAIKRQYRRRIISNGCPEVTTENGSSDSAAAVAAGGDGVSGNGIASPATNHNQLVRVKRKYHRSNAFSKLANISAKRAYTRGKSTSSLTSAISSQDLIKEYQGFIDKFAIPTHLYAYLAERHRERRLYAYRNLSYLMPAATGKRSPPRPRPSLEEIVNRLKQNCLQNQSLASSKALKLDHSLLPPGEWPQELEIIFDGFFDSEKELEWVTVNASVSLRLRFGWAWRRKMCPSDTVIKITNHPIRMNCYSQSTGYSTIINTHANNSGSLTNNTSNGGGGGGAHEKDDKRKQLTNNNNNSIVNACRFSLTHLLDEVQWQASGSRLTTIQLELHVSAVEKRLLKRPDIINSPNGILSSMPMNSTPTPTPPPTTTNQNNTTLQSTSTSTTPTTSSPSLSLSLGNPISRKTGLSVASYPVHYVTAPLPLITTPYNFNTSSALRQFHLIPGYYELRLGVDSSETNESTYSTTNTTSIPINFPPVIGQVDNTCSGSIEWKRIRFPKSSTAEDEYSRWPRLRFSVVWHKKSIVKNENISSLSRLIETRSQYIKNNTSNNNKFNSNHTDSPVESDRVSYTRSMTNSLSRDSIKYEKHQLNLSAKSNNSSSPTTRVSTTESHITNGINGNHLSNSIDQDISLSSDHANEMNHSQSSIVPVAVGGGGERAGGELEVSQHTAPTNSPFPDHPISFAFVYGDNLSHWCISTDLKCPWCYLDCSRAGNKGIEALLIHLRSSHGRFRFKAKWNSTRNQISLQVTLNDAYDGSNDCGLRRWCIGVYKNFIKRCHLITPSQLFVNGWMKTDNDPSESNNNNNKIIKKEDNSDYHQYSSSSNSHIKAILRIRCPIRRFPYTHIIFWRGAELCTSSNELVDSTVSVQPMLVGHNRVYYHTTTTQPIRACEIHVDSDDDDAPDWLRQHYQRKVEEFSDVNQGEIKVMELWNYFLLSIRPSILIVSDIQVAILTCQFIHKYYRLIHSRRLRANLILHLNNLIDYGLLSCEHLFYLIRIYDQFVMNATSKSFLQQNQLVADSSIQALSALLTASGSASSSSSSSFSSSMSISSSLWPSPSATKRTPPPSSLPLSTALIKPEELNHHHHHHANSNNGHNNNNNNNKRREMRIPPPPVFEALRMSFTS